MKESIGCHQDLYTGVINEAETDEIETWLNYEIEFPAQVALEKIDRKEKLSVAELEKLVRYVAAQYLRTPAAYFRAKIQYEKMATSTATEVITSYTERDINADNKKVSSTIHEVSPKE